tara:strand:+ start:1974 stop:2270 length:297 start_codon:yes stop_codon:yes gene_type:complete
MDNFAECFRGFFHVVAEFSTEKLNFVVSQRFCLRNMKRSKKIFVAVGLVFIVATIIVGYDISRKTSFPGSKKYLKESIAPSDIDTAQNKDMADTLKLN